MPIRSSRNFRLHASYLGTHARSEEDVLSYIAFPQQAEQFFERREQTFTASYSFKRLSEHGTPIAYWTRSWIALSGIVIVFLMLAPIWGVIAVIPCDRRAEKTPRIAASVSAAAPAAAAAGSSAGTGFRRSSWKGVSEVEAACIMAIVSHETGIPLDQLVFKSIKAV